MYQLPSLHEDYPLALEEYDDPINMVIDYAEKYDRIFQEEIDHMHNSIQFKMDYESSFIRGDDHV